MNRSPAVGYSPSGLNEKFITLNVMKHGLDVFEISSYGSFSGISVVIKLLERLVNIQLDELEQSFSWILGKTEAL